MTPREALAWIDATQRFGMRPGLERIGLLLDRLGSPERRLRCLHVAGTNGKGSVCAMIDAVARAHGLRVGLYTSPHLVRFHERIQIDRRPIDDPHLARGLTRIRDLLADADPHPTYFEIATALALAHFAENDVDLVALETGLGGRLDATNAVSPIASILVAIDVDHAEHLGATPAMIAAEKAGILKRDTPAFSYPQSDDVAAVLEKVARERGAPLAFLRQPYSPDRPLALPGDHQRWNAALALAALQVAIPDLDETRTTRALASIDWPGRFHRHPPFLLDGAHNPHAIAALARTWQSLHGADARAPVVFGALADKDVPSMLRSLAQVASHLLLVPVKNPRALDVDRLLDIQRATVPEIPTTRHADLHAALDTARLLARPVHIPILVTGSLFLVGDFLRDLTRAPQRRPTR